MARINLKMFFQILNIQKKNLKEGGLIIIDDYELKFSKTKLDKNVKNQCDFEGISSNSKNKQLFHPGVTKAVYKHFGNIEPVNGLMIVKKKKNIFKAVYSAYRGQIIKLLFFNIFKKFYQKPIPSWYLYTCTKVHFRVQHCQKHHGQLSLHQDEMQFL